LWVVFTFHAVTNLIGFFLFAATNEKFTITSYLLEAVEYLALQFATNVPLLIIICIFPVVVGTVLVWSIKTDDLATN